MRKITEARVATMPAVTTPKEWERYGEGLRKDTLDKVVFRDHAAQWHKAKAGEVLACRLDPVDTSR